MVRNLAVGNGFDMKIPEQIFMDRLEDHRFLWVQEGERGQLRKRSN